MSRRHGLLVVVAGPSGVGKGAVHTRVREQIDDAVLSVSVTTRPRRPGERDGVHYRFVDRPTFERLAREGALLEWAEYAGHLYGTPREPVADAVADGKVVVLDIEVQGVMQIKKQVPGALAIFLLPPSLEELERRLRARGTEGDAAIAARLARAREELAERDRFDLQVVNDDLDRCVAEVVDAVEQARMRPLPQ